MYYTGSYITEYHDSKVKVSGPATIGELSQKRIDFNTCQFLNFRLGVMIICVQIVFPSPRATFYLEICLSLVASKKSITLGPNS